MPNAKYLPICSGMPAPAPSSDPISLTSVLAVETYLAGTPFASQSISDLGGGSVNYVYRVHLLSPFENSQTIVLKHAQPFVKLIAGLAWELERQVFEVEAMTRVRLSLAPASLVTVPKIYHFDIHNNVIIMEDCGVDGISLREFLCSGHASSPGVAETVGRAVGEFLASMHEWSRNNPDGVLDVFDNSLHAKKMAAHINCDFMSATLPRPDTNDPSLLPDLEVVPSDIQAISKLSNEYRSRVMSTRDPVHDVLVMGDLGHENIIVNITQQPPRLYVLDWELARTGSPGSDTGLFCAYMEFLVRSNQTASTAASVILWNFIDAYSRISNRDTFLAQDTLLYWGLAYVVWAPRDPVGDKSLVHEFVKEGIKYLVHFRDEAFLAQLPVKPLLPGSTTEVN